MKTLNAEKEWKKLKGGEEKYFTVFTKDNEYNITAKDIVELKSKIAKFENVKAVFN